MANELSGKVAVVTGASKGIGAEIAVHLAAAGAAVVVNYASSREGAEKAVDRIKAAGGRAVAVQADLSKPDQAKTLFDHAQQHFGGVDILVNNAGVYAFGTLDTVTPEFYHRQFDLNVLGLILATQEAARRFGDKGGSVINVSSAVSTGAMVGMPVYAATKAAVDSLTRTLAAELGPKNIRVNAINPGPVITEGAADFFNEGSPMRQQMESQTPLGRIGEVDDIAPVVTFLASDAAKWVTGETLRTAGGLR